MGADDEIREAIRAHLEQLREVSQPDENIISMDGVTTIIHRQFELVPPSDIKVLVKDEAQKLGFLPLED